MSSDDSSGVTLAFVDPSLLSSWEGMVKLSVECSLLLKHGKGKIIATTPSPCSTLSSSTTSPSSAEKRKKEEEGEQGETVEGSSITNAWCRLTEQHAAASAIAPASSNQSPGRKEKLVLSVTNVTSPQSRSAV